MAEIESLKQAVAVSPDNVPLLLMLGNAHMENFQTEEAREVFDNLLKIQPQHAEARTCLARLLHFSGKCSEAILRIEQVCLDSPKCAPAWILRSTLSLNEGDAAQAREYYEKAVAIDSRRKDKELLKRIEQAGGKKGSGGSKKIQPIGDQAGIYLISDSDDDELFEIFADDDQDEDEYDEEADLDCGTRSDVNFAKVGGMESVKEDIRMKVLYPMQNEELFKAYGKTVGGGVLLYGPPGCGKTLLSWATAGEIEVRFICVGLHEILDMYIGQSENKLHDVFELARKWAPVVLFFDEVDALAADRKDLRGSAGRTLVNQFLAEMDGTMNNNEGILVLGATNAPWHLDSAFLRPGRFDRLIFVPPPDDPAKEEIIKIMAQGKPVVGLDAAALAKKMKDFSGADIKAVFDHAIEESLHEAMKSGKIVPVTNKQLLTGAKKVKPSTKKWFESAKNYALYANQSGFYDDVLTYLGLDK